MQKITFLIIALLIFFSNTLFAQHLKKDSTPDRRYRENRTYSPSSNYSNSTVHLKKDRALDRRYKQNRTYSSTQSTSTSPSYKYYTSTRKNKTVYYYSVKRDANGKVHRSQSARHA